MGRSPSEIADTGDDTTRFSYSGTDPSTVADALEATIDEHL
jgi:hypothetical protein